MTTTQKTLALAVSGLLAAMMLFAVTVGIAFAQDAADTSVTGATGAMESTTTPGVPNTGAGDGMIPAVLGVAAAGLLGGGAYLLATSRRKTEA